MKEQIKMVAKRVKELREIAEISKEDLAREFNIPIEIYNEYENGDADIPVSFLYKIAHKFNIELAAIITGEEPKLHTYCVVRKGKGVDVDRIKQYKYKSLAYDFIHKKAEPFLVTVEPGLKDEEIVNNSHPGQEFNYVLEGVVKVTIDGHEVLLNEGDSLFFNSSLIHSLKALENKTAKLLAVIV